MFTISSGQLNYLTLSDSCSRCCRRLNCRCGCGRFYRSCSRWLYAFGAATTIALGL
nr:MAG TPA: hypothetical protein [Caudoviricetes sp.]